MRFVIIDLEATCWEDGRHRDQREIIEIGAVLLESLQGPVCREFSAFVRPVQHPCLSDFCTRLTSIRQEDVDTADDFSSSFTRFVEWIGPEPFTLCSWGDYDLKQIREECERNGVPFPSHCVRHINLKKEFARLRRTRPMGMKAALSMLGLPLRGSHHRGIDDARNIAQLASFILPHLEANDGR